METASSSPTVKPAPQVNMVTSRNPKILMIAGLGVLILVLIAIVGIISGAHRHRAAAPDQAPDALAAGATASPGGPAAGSAVNDGSVSGMGTPTAVAAGGATSVAGLPVPPPAGTSAAGLPGPNTPAGSSLASGPSPVIPGSGTDMSDRGLMDGTSATAGANTPAGSTIIGAIGPNTPAAPATGGAAGSSTEGASTPTSRHETAVAAGGPARAYTVQASDTLWKIAQKVYGNGAKWHLIVKANPGLTPARLRTGMKIKLPEGAASGSALAQASGHGTHATAMARKTITVRQGDTLYAISRRAYGNGEYWDVIYRANKSKLSDPHNIPAGMTLIIPARNG